MRDLLLPGDDELTTVGRNTPRFRMEYAVVVTFLYDQDYECNEYCKYAKNVENTGLQVHPGRPAHLLRRRRSPTSRGS